MLGVGFWNLPHSLFPMTEPRPVPRDSANPALRNSRTPTMSALTVDHEKIFLVDSHRWEEPKVHRLAWFADERRRFGAAPVATKRPTNSDCFPL